jgi:hypothetical protein
MHVVPSSHSILTLKVLAQTNSSDELRAEPASAGLSAAQADRRTGTSYRVELPKQYAQLSYPAPCAALSDAKGLS